MDPIVTACTTEGRPSRRSSDVPRGLLLVVVPGLPGRYADRYLRAAFSTGPTDVTVLVIDRWMRRLTLDDDGLFRRRGLNPSLPEAVAHSLLADVGVGARVIQCATPAEIVARSRQVPINGSIVVLPARRFRDRCRRAMLAWRVRRPDRPSSQALHPLESW